MSHMVNGAIGHSFYGMGFPFGGLIMGVFIIAVITLLIVLLLRSNKSRKDSLLSAKEKGIDILVERYARGEIDAETFKTMKDTLNAKE